MTTYNQGDTVLVPFKFTDNDGEKPRPALILSSKTFNRNHNKSIMTPITSSIRNETCEIKIIGQENELAGLRAESVIRTEILMTFDNQRIIRKIGSITEGLFKTVLGKVLENFSRT